MMKRAVFVALIGAVLMHAVIDAQQASVNTSVLPGVPLNPLDPNDATAKLKTDLVMQRQVEPDIVASTRNPLHLLASFNDYRAVVLAADGGQSGQFASRSFLQKLWARLTGRPVPEHRMPAAAAAAEASVGLSWSNDGGLTWSGALMPGSLDDTSAASLSAPIYGLEAMTDPKGAAAPCGIVYKTFIAFTRGGQSKVVVARWQDRNNADGGVTWFYQGMVVVETGNNASNGPFHDLPAIAVDIDRSGKSKDPCSHNVYVGWARFTGTDGASKLNFARFTAGNGPFNPAVRTSFLTAPDMTNQAVALSVDPRPGTPKAGGGGMLYYAWRSFATPANPSALARVWITSSRDFGESFAKATIVTGNSPVYFFDQPTLPANVWGESFMAFRSNALSTIQVVPHPTANSSKVFMAWAERVDVGTGLPAANGDPKIVLTRLDGTTWSQRTAVDFGDRDVPGSDIPAPGYGHLPQQRSSGPQIMPKLTFGGGRLGLLYYESRQPLNPVPGTAGFIAGRGTHVDARFALLDPITGQKIGTNQISRYPVKFKADLSNGETAEDILDVVPGVPYIWEVAGVPSDVKKINNRFTEPNSGGGFSPFVGDYINATPIVPFVFDQATQTWKHAISALDVPFQGFRTVFTDSRNQIPVAVDQYPFYDPPGQNEPPCINPGSRNHDVFHVLVDAGVAVNAATTFKELGLIERAFPVSFYNPTAGEKFFQVTFDKPLLASFDQFNPGPDELKIHLLPYSSTTRTVFVSSTDPKASVKVLVTELQLTCTPNDPADPLATPNCTQAKPGGDTGSATLNLDPTNPSFTADNDTETHNPLVTSPLVTSPLVTSPLVTSNTAFAPLVTSPLVTSPLVTSPLVTSAALEDETVYEITDLTWAVQNAGNVNSSYFSAINLAGGDLLKQQGNYVFQLLIYKTAMTAGLAGCKTFNQPQDQILSNIPNPLVTSPLVTSPLVTSPLVTSPLVTSATFNVAPQNSSLHNDGTLHDHPVRDAVFVTLRGYRISPAVPPGEIVFNQATAADLGSIAVFADAANIVDGVIQNNGVPPAAGNFFVVTNTNDSGAGSLRAVLAAADATAALDAITFNIPGLGPHSINLLSALPEIVSPVVIDATTQPGFAGSPVVVLNGMTGDVQVAGPGLHISAGNSIVRGLAINRFGGNGILLATNGGNLIEGNYIGTNATGTAAQGNGYNGVQVIDSPNNTIGGTTAAARNVIAGNAGEEVRLDGANATGNVIRGNYIGTNAAGSAVLSSSSSGVFIRRAPGNSVIGNVVSGNLGFAGIAICGNPTFCGGGDIGTQTSDASGNVIKGNLVGTNAAGSAALANGGFGVSIDGASNTIVGGPTAAERNVIANSGSHGVVVFAPPASGNQIRGNSIFANGGLGIDLAPGGVTANDAGDADTGPNNLQNFPVLSSAISGSGVTTIAGTLNSTPGGVTFTIDFYSNAACDPSGNGEGATFIGSRTVTTNGAGDASTDATFGFALAAGLQVTATATDSAGNTSEFSNCVVVTSGTPSGLITFQDQAVGAYAGETVTLSSGGVNVTFSGAGLQIRDMGSSYPAGASRVLSTTSDLQPITTTLTFSQGVTANFVQIRNWLHDGTAEVDHIEMSAYNASDELLGTVTSSAEFISLAFDGIAKVTFDDVAGDWGNGYIIDDFQFNLEGSGGGGSPLALHDQSRHRPTSRGGSIAIAESVGPLAVLHLKD